MTSVAAEGKRVSVGIGHLAVATSPADVLIAYGLGSCIGVSAWDPSTKIAAMVHVLLPASEGRPPNPLEPARFADSGIDALLKALVDAGAKPRNLYIKVAGGASVLGSANAEKFKIGQRNAEAVSERLKRFGLRPVAEDLGGTKGRTMEMQVATGKTFVRTAAAPAREL
jgi:chemotaxis protein CheD